LGSPTYKRALAIEQRATAEEKPPPGAAVASKSRFGSDNPLPDVSHQCVDAAEFEVASVDQPGPVLLVRNDGNLVVLPCIAVGEGTADPQALSFRGSNFGRGFSLGSDLPSNWARTEAC